MATHLDTIYEEEEDSEICFGEEYPTVLLAPDEDLNLSVEFSRLLLGDDLNTAILQVSDDDDDDTHVGYDDSCDMESAILDRSFCVFEDSSTSLNENKHNGDFAQTDSDYGTDEVQTSSSADSSIGSQSISNTESGTDQTNLAEANSVKSINDSSGDQENMGICRVRRLRSNFASGFSGPLLELRAKDIVSIQFETSYKA